MDMFDYVKPIQRDFDPDVYVIHIGKNNLTTGKTPYEICFQNIVTDQGT